MRSQAVRKAQCREEPKTRGLLTKVEPGLGGAKAWGIRRRIERPHSILDDRYGKNKADDDEKKEKLDLLPRRHVGRRRPQNRVELRLRRRQIVQVRVPKRL